MSNENKIDNRKVVIGFGSKLFEVILWVLLIFPGIIFMYKKKKAKKFLNELNRQIDDCYVTINNLLNERINILRNIYSSLSKEDNFAKFAFSEISKESNLTKKGQSVETATNEIDNLVKGNNELRNKNIFDEIERNKNLEKEIFSIKDTYNNAVLQWNKEIFLWPTNKIVAAKQGYTTIETYDVFPKIKVNGKQGLLK